jgi:plasmid stabilization system protein ParE
MYSLFLKPRAILMTKKAYDWYEEQKQGLGEAFLSELDTCYRKLASHPDHYGKIKKNIRQVAVKRVPFVVIYEILKKEVVVFAVFHTKRNPKYRTRD